MELYFAALKKQTDFYIKKAFYECLEQNIPLNITTLCAQAGIGRRTFYRHFSSVDEVFQCCIASLFSEYRHTIRPLKNYEIEQIAKEFFGFWETKKRELRLLGRYDEAKLSLIKERSDDRFHLFSVYSAGVFLGLLNWWIAEDFQTPVQELIVQFVQETENIFSKDIS